MALPVWPVTLPDLIGVQGQLGTSKLYEPPLRTDFDDGPGRSRRRRLYRETPRNITMVFTRAEFVNFKTFVTDTLKDGASRFTASIRGPDGTLGARTVRIDGEVSEQDEGPHSRVSFRLVVQDW